MAAEKRKSGQQIAGENLRRFRQWISERDRAGDWADYVRDDSLNRSDLALECGFGRSALRQNPAIKVELEALETRLQLRKKLPPDQRNGGNVSSGGDSDSSEAVARRLLQSKSSFERRIKELEEQNASLKAQVAMLREANRKFSHLESHLGATGRLVLE